MRFKKNIYVFEYLDKRIIKITIIWNKALPGEYAPMNNSFIVLKDEFLSSGH
jgi:hypothetical protein